MIKLENFRFFVRGLMPRAKFQRGLLFLNKLATIHSAAKPQPKWI